jgi:hypothetical protein
MDDKNEQRLTIRLSARARAMAEREQQRLEQELGVRLSLAQVVEAMMRAGLPDEQRAQVG